MKLFKLLLLLILPIAVSAASFETHSVDDEKSSIIVDVEDPVAIAKITLKLIDSGPGVFLMEYSQNASNYLTSSINLVNESIVSFTPAFDQATIKRKRLLPYSRHVITSKKISKNKYNLVA